MTCALPATWAQTAFTSRGPPTSSNATEAFGKPLIDHEGVGFMLAENMIDLKQAELMIDWCAGVLDTGSLGTVESSMAKVAVSEALMRIADRCVQVITWWSEVFEIPCVALDVADTEHARALSAAGADFIGITIAADQSASEAAARVRAYSEAVSAHEDAT